MRTRWNAQHTETAEEVAHWGVTEGASGAKRVAQGEYRGWLSMEAMEGGSGGTTSAPLCEGKWRFGSGRGLTTGGCEGERSCWQGAHNRRVPGLTTGGCQGSQQEGARAHNRRVPGLTTGRVPGLTTGGARTHNRRVPGLTAAASGVAQEGVRERSFGLGRGLTAAKA